MTEQRIATFPEGFADTIWQQQWEDDGGAIYPEGVVFDHRGEPINFSSHSEWDGAKLDAYAYAHGATFSEAFGRTDDDYEDPRGAA